MDRGGLDWDVLAWVVGIRVPWLTTVFTEISVVGGTVPIAVITVLIAGVLASSGQRGAAGALVLIGFTGWLAMNAIKFAVRRERPPIGPRLVEIGTYSFPSGHAMVAAVFAASVTLIAARHRRVLVGVVLGLSAALIGLSRVYLAAHWFSDVLAGWVFGVIWAWAGYVLWRRYESARGAGSGSGSGSTEVI